MQKVPVPQARGRKHHHFSSIRAARIFAVMQTALGVLCMLLTEQIHSLFPFILGIQAVTESKKEMINDKN